MGLVEVASNGRVPEVDVEEEEEDAAEAED